MKKNLLILVALIILMIFATSCAHVAPVQECTQNMHIYGFWGGLWHGFIAVFALIFKIFNHDIAVYAVNNTGGWYDFGFLLGIGAFSSRVV